MSCVTYDKKYLFQKQWTHVLDTLYNQMNKMSHIFHIKTISQNNMAKL
jgi:hypothetical protein